MSLVERIALDWGRVQGVPGLAIAVLRDGDPLYVRGVGSLFQTASLGKHFTAALAILLAGSGDGPGLDAAITAYLPEIGDRWGAITLRHLLSHTGGIPHAGYDGLDFTRDYSDSEIVAAIASGGALEFPAGTSWCYSNAGYVLAGIAIGRAAGVFYGDLLRDRIFAPLGMSTARVNGPDAPIGSAEWVSPSLNRLADGGITVSIRDFVQWEKALCSDWGRQVAEMFVETPLTGGQGSGYGLGWFVSQSACGRVAEHEGSWQGFHTMMVRHMDEGLTAVVLANGDDCDVSALAGELIRAARGEA